MPRHKKERYNRVTNLYTTDIDARVSELRTQIAEISSDQESLLALKEKLVGLLKTLNVDSHAQSSAASSNTDATTQETSTSNTIFKEYSKLLECGGALPPAGSVRRSERPVKPPAPPPAPPPHAPQQGKSGRKRGRPSKQVKPSTSTAVTPPTSMLSGDSSDSDDNDTAVPPTAGADCDNDGTGAAESHELEYLHDCFDFLSASPQKRENASGPAGPGMGESDAEGEEMEEDREVGDIMSA